MEEEKIEKEQFDLRKLSYFNDYHLSNVNLYGKGKGTEFDPIIIKPHKELPKDLNISFLTSYILITDLNSNTQRISMSLCDNVTIKNCKFQEIELCNCKNIIFEHVKFTNKLSLSRCEKLTIIDCEIPIMKFRYCLKNEFKNCQINKIIKIFDSRENKFIGNSIPSKEIKKLNKKNYVKRSTVIGILTMSIISIVAFLYMKFRFQIKFNDPLILLWVIYLGLFLAIISNILRIDIRASKRRRLKYSPNFII